MTNNSAMSRKRWNFKMASIAMPDLMSAFILPLMLASALTALTTWPSSAMADEENPLTATATITPQKMQAGGTAEIVIDLKLQPHYHAYSERFKLTVDTPDDLKVDQYRLSPTVQFQDSITKKMITGIENHAVMRATVEVPSGFITGSQNVKVNLTYQACTSDHCLFPKHIIMDVPIDVGPALAGAVGLPGATAATVSALAKGAALENQANSAPATTTDSAQVSKSSESKAGGFNDALSHGTFSALLFVFLIGMLTSLTPCIYPMIPITLAVLGARTKGQSKLKGFSISFTYVLGIAFTYSILGVTAAKTGALFGSALSNVYVVSSIAMLFVVMGLSMYGLFELQVPAFLRDKVGTAQTGSGYGGAFATGLIAGVVASPCVGPVLVSVLTYIAQTQNMLLGFWLLFTFAMGLGVLFMVLGTSSAMISKVPKAGAWMEHVKFVFGTVMVAMALYYVQPLYPAWLFNILTGLAAILIASAYGAFEPNEKLEGAGRLRKGVMLATFVIGLAFSLIGVMEKAGIQLNTGGGAVAAGRGGENSATAMAWKPFSESLLKTALAQHKPVIMDFSADWCGACKELEKYTFSDTRVKAMSDRFTLLHIDATEDSAALDTLKKQYSIVGLPTMLFFDAAGTLRTELTLTGFEEAEPFMKRMGSASGASAVAEQHSIEHASSAADVSH